MKLPPSAPVPPPPPRFLRRLAPGAAALSVILPARRHCAQAYPNAGR